MTSLPIPIDSTTSEIERAQLVEEARTYIAASRSPNTLRAYAADWRHFDAWCLLHYLGALPANPSTVVLYISDMARTAKTATIRRRLSSISVAHQAAGQPSP